MKFGCIIGNPPYQAPQKAMGKRGGGNYLWDKFVEKSFELVKQNGFICLVHPSAWRKPQSKNSKTRKLQPLMMSKNIKYLEIHDPKDGKATFGVKTRYDWYVMQNCPLEGKTIVKDENGNISEIDLKDCIFLPNANFDLIKPLIAKDKDEKCPVLFSASYYETRKKWMNKEEINEYKYPCVNTIHKTGPIFWYSSRNDKGFFGTPKVILDDTNTRMNDVIIDLDGEYGLTHQAIGIQVQSKQEA